MKRFFTGILTSLLLLFLVAGCLTSDDGGSGSDSGVDDQDNNGNSVTFSEKMNDIYDAYLSSRDSLYADANAELTVIYDSYRSNKSVINKQFTDAIEAAFEYDTSSPQKSATNEVMQSILDALDDYQGESSSENESAANDAQEVLDDLNAQLEEQDSDLAGDAESAYDSSSDDGSSLYDAFGDIFDGNNDGGGSSSEGESVGEACAETFGEGSINGDSAALEEINNMLEDYGNAEDPQSQSDAAQDVLDSIQDQLDLQNPDGESDVRSIEDTINHYLEEGASESDALDFINNLLEINAVNDGVLPIGLQNVTLIINYSESLNLVLNGINTQSEDTVAGILNFTVDIPLGVSTFDYSTEGDLLYEGSGTDNITGTTWTNSGTAHVKASGIIHINDEDKPAITIKLVFTYSFTNSTNHPILGTINIPGEKDSWTDTVIMEYHNGAEYEYVLDQLSNKFSKEISLIIDE